VQGLARSGRAIPAAGDRPALPVFGAIEKFEAERALVAKRLAASTSSSPASH
jgi:hypothetical protein